jgi:hypothetical protein
MLIVIQHAKEVIFANDGIFSWYRRNGLGFATPRTRLTARVHTLRPPRRGTPASVAAVPKLAIRKRAPDRGDKPAAPAATGSLLFDPDPIIRE